MKVLQVLGAYPTKERPESNVFTKRQIESLEPLGVESILCIFNEGRGLYRYILGYRKMMRLLQEHRIDLIHAHYAYFGWVARAQTRTSVVVSFMGSDVVGAFKRSGWINAVDSWLHKVSAFLLSLCTTRTIVKSRNLARYTVRSKTDTIPNGVDTTLFRPLDRETCCRAVGFDPHKRYVLFSSSENAGKPVKRIELARAAYRLAAHQRTGTEFYVLNGKPSEEIVHFLNAADVLLLTSISEGSPNIIKESLACNLPIVSVDVGDVRERIEGVTNSTIASADPDALAKALVSVLDSEQRSNGREKVLALSLENVANRIITVYQQCL
jgi:teichuronic acid biosynthesis glycosyltransferase TuaC